MPIKRRPPLSAELVDIAGHFRQQAVNLAVIFQGAETDARFRGRALAVRHAHVDLAPGAGRDRGAEHEFVAAHFARFDEGHILRERNALRKHFSNDVLLSGAVHAARKISSGRPLARCHFSAPSLGG